MCIFTKSSWCLLSCTLHATDNVVKPNNKKHTILHISSLRKLEINDYNII